MRRFGCLAGLWMVAAAMSAAFAAPPRVYDSPKKFRFLSLAEARACALEHGTINLPSLLFPNDSSIVVPQGEGTIHMHFGCKPGSKYLILTNEARHLRPAEFERNINQILLNIENMYWNLYGSYWQLHSREQGLRFAKETLKITQAQYRAGRVGQSAVAQAEGQYNLFRSQRLQAIDNVCDNQRQLFAMMGLPIEEGTWLVPCDAPTLVEKNPDWKEAHCRAFKHRPELRLARQDVKLACYEVESAKEASEAARSAKDSSTCDAELRQAKLEQQRARLVLQDQELKAERFLGLYYRRMSSAYFQIKAARAQREAFATQLEIRYQLYRVGANEPGTGNPVTLNLLLEAQRFWAEALASEYQAITTYNNALAGWEYAKGDIMKYAHVRIPKEAAPSEGEVVPAVEREHKRTRQHVRRESALVASSPLTAPDACRNGEDVKAPSLVALWKSCPPLKQAETFSSIGQAPLVARKLSDIFPSQDVHKTH